MIAMIKIGGMISTRFQTLWKYRKPLTLNYLYSKYRKYSEARKRIRANSTWTW